MPRHDPLPVPLHALRRRFWRIARVIALFSVIVGILAAVIVTRSEPIFHLHLVIATALGAGFSVLVGAGLMTLVFLSSKSGHDLDAGSPPPRGDRRND